MPGRQAGKLGRFGFNGKEQDSEAKGTGAQYDYGFRIYDPRVNRFLSVDPLTMKYPELTPYQFASNTPIQAVDIDGLEGGVTHYDLTPHIKRIWNSVKSWWSAPPTSGQKLVAKGNAQRLGYDDYVPETKGDAFMTAVATGMKDYNQYGTYYSSWGGMFGSLGRRNVEIKSKPNAAPQQPNVSVVESKADVKLVPGTNTTTSTTQIKQTQFATGSEEVSAVPISRAQGGIGNNSSQQRVVIGSGGKVSIIGDDMLFVTIDDKAHSVYFYNKRGGSEGGAKIVSFTIPKSLAEEIKAQAVPQEVGKAHPNRPQQVDLTKSQSAYGLPKNYIEKLRAQLIQGTGTVEEPASNPQSANR
jgi:RHS repeat-associated protein